MKKFVFILIAIIVICISVYCLNVISNSTTSSTTTSTQTTLTVTTTMSKEEILKNHIDGINKSLISTLEEKYGLFNAKYFGYINFQDFVKGTENNLSEYFFIGSKAFGLSQEYTDTKFYKNSDALNQLKKWDIEGADYLFVYQTTKKDEYGKEKACTTYVVVQENDDDTFSWNLFDTHDEWGLGAMIMCVAEEKCNVNH